MGVNTTSFITQEYYISLGIVCILLQVSLQLVLGIRSHDHGIGLLEASIFNVIDFGAIGDGQHDDNPVCFYFYFYFYKYLHFII